MSGGSGAYPDGERDDGNHCKSTRPAQRPGAVANVLPKGKHGFAPEKIAPIMAQMAAIQLRLAMRLVAESGERAEADGDNLLTVEEAAAKLKCSEDWLYRRAKRLSFRVRVGRNGESPEVL